MPSVAARMCEDLLPKFEREFVGLHSRIGFVSAKDTGMTSRDGHEGEVGQRGEVCSIIKGSGKRKGRHRSAYVCKSSQHINQVKNWDQDRGPPISMTPRQKHGRRVRIAKLPAHTHSHIIVGIRPADILAIRSSI